MSPKDLIEKAKSGDNEAFGVLYEQYYLPIFRYIHFRIKKKEDTQDLVQIVFLKVYESIERYEDRGKDPLSFFFTVARTTVIDYLRRKKDLPLYENVDIKTEDGPEEYAETNEQAELVNQSIQGLNEDQKEVILLKFMAELPNNEIATQIGKSEESVRQIQHRALEILKKKLKKLL